MMDVIKKRLSRALSGESRSNATTTKVRGRRGALSAFNFRKSGLSKSLLAAATAGDATKIRELLEGGPDLGDIDETNKAVKIACENGHLEVLATLIRFGATINMLGDENVSPLHVAASKGSVEVITLLVRNGVNVNIPTKYEKRAPLHFAALRGRDESVRALLEGDSKITADICDIYGSTPLHLATRMGHIEVVKTLLSYKKQVSVNAYDNEGWTAIHLAAERGDTNMARVLIAHHTQIDSQNKYGRTPLHWATIKGHSDMVQLLLQHGASATLKDLHGKCALDYADEPNIRNILRINCSSPVKNDRVNGGSTIGDFIKIETRGSFIRRLALPLPSVIKCTASVRRKKPDTVSSESMDTIAEESESRRSSLARMDEEWSTERGVTDDLSSSKGSLLKSLFTRKRPSQTATSSSGLSRQSSYQSSASDKDEDNQSHSLTVKPIDPIELTINAEVLSSSSVNGDITACRDVPEGSPVSQRRCNNNDIHQIDTLPSPEVMMGQAQFQAMVLKIERHHMDIGTIVDAVTDEIGKAASGKCILSNENLNNLSNKMHKIQDLIFELQEEVTQHADLINATMKMFMDTIRQRLSPRDVLPACLYQAFFHSAVIYLVDESHGYRLLIQKMPAISEEKRSDMLETVTNTETMHGKCNQSLYFALANSSEANRNTPLRGLLLLLTKCQFERNAVQLIITQFIKMASSSQSCSLEQNNLFILSYRLGEDGKALANHLGVPVSRDNDELGKPNQEQNLEILSRWRHMNTTIGAVEHTFDLVEGLIVIGREDLLVWVLSNHQRSKSI